MASSNPDFELIRQIHTVLAMHFLNGQKQSEIAQALNLSTSKVNRLIMQGRQMGMVEIEIKSPFQRLSDIEHELVDRSSLSNAVVTPAVPGSAEATLSQVGKSAAAMLTESIRDGDVIAITGGKGVAATVAGLANDPRFDVKVVPLTGAVQGKYHTDVNHLASLMAERLGGEAIMSHAPLFAESEGQRDMLMGINSIRQTFDLARQAQVVLLGIGSVEPEGSSYYDLHHVSDADRQMMIHSGIVAEFMAHLIRPDGAIANYALNSRLVALKPAELAKCGKVIGIASGPEKVRPIRAVLHGGYINSLITDEGTGLSVLEDLKGAENVA